MIYLDNAATTKMSEKALDAYVDACRNFFANPSALHSYGMEAENLIRETKKYIASVISASEFEIFFTKSFQAALLRSLCFYKKLKFPVSPAEQLFDNFIIYLFA